MEKGDFLIIRISLTIKNEKLFEKNMNFHFSIAK